MEQVDVLEAMKQVKAQARIKGAEDNPAVFVKDDPAAKVQYWHVAGKYGWQFTFETGETSFIPDWDDFEAEFIEPDVGAWYKQNYGGGYYQILEVYRKESLYWFISRMKITK